MSRCADFAIEPPTDIDLVCFDTGFLVPEGSEPLTTGSLTYAAFGSSLNTDELERFYDRELLPDWTSVGSEQSARVYQRVLDNGNECQLYLKFAQRTDTHGTILAANVYPSFVDTANLPAPEGFAAPIVVQSLTSATIMINANVQTVLAKYTADFEAEGWAKRDELTEICADSAFVTFARNDYEMHLTIDYQNGRSTVRLQTRSAACGPVFFVP